MAQSQEPFFKKVIESQKAWVKRTSAYLLTNNRDTRGTPMPGDDHLFQLCP